MDPNDTGQRAATTGRMDRLARGMAHVAINPAGVLLRSDGHVSGLIRRCDGEFSANPILLRYLDTGLATLCA
ncbi:MAG: hypothetical protein JO093_14570 [Acidobacteria bacterium]|nr:hypothetical protein [Acidobacteriota bacterium]